ncbi:MAG: hypothetical protein JRJ12_03285 [Deltaproteobacteria bacterium]|nr:hypothetical protein [Deltaproteobacteria bacterium]MBW2069710.1 hypothetical protein [Deltaproteobacteria bacterium]
MELNIDEQQQTAALDEQEPRDVAAADLADARDEKHSAADDSQEQDSEAAAEKKTSKHKLLFASAAAVVVLLAVAIAAGILLSRNEPQAGSSSQSALLRQSSEHLQDFFIPLQEGTNQKVVQVSVEVSWPAEARKRFRRNRIAIRDDIYGVLARMAGSQLMSGREAEVQAEIRKILEWWLQSDNISIWVEWQTTV